MKIIFLDIDGVLNSVEYSVGMKHYRNDVFMLNEADPVKVGLLRFVVEQTGAKIVISSSWRIGKNKSWFEGYFERMGWPMPPIVGMTPVDARKRSGVGRGDEVLDWLEDNIASTDPDPHVIVDDDSDFYNDQPLVQTNGVYGLTLKETIAMIDILGCKPDAKISTVESLREHVDFNR